MNHSPKEIAEDLQFGRVTQWRPTTDPPRGSKPVPQDPWVPRPFASA